MASLDFDDLGTDDANSIRGLIASRTITAKPIPLGTANEGFCSGFWRWCRQSSSELDNGRFPCAAVEPRDDDQRP